MDFFNSAIDGLQTLVTAIGAGLAIVEDGSKKTSSCSNAPRSGRDCDHAGEQGKHTICRLAGKPYGRFCADD